MLIKLYPADNETKDSAEEILGLLYETGCRCQLVELEGIGQAITVLGNYAEVCRHVRAWLDQHPGRMATPATICDSMIRQGTSITTVEIYRPGMGFA